MCQGLHQGRPPRTLAMEPEGARVPLSERVIDSHVHLFPPGVYEALWRWFDQHAWAIRYRLHAEQVLEFLQARGIERVVGLMYAHRPGMAGFLNRFMHELCLAHPMVWGLGTVLPGEEGGLRIAREALDTFGLRGLKLHCHVQRFAPDDPGLDPVYALAAERGKPIVIHAGREPSRPADRAGIHARCAAWRIERVLERHPDLILVVPHLGADEIPDYLALLARFPGLHLDTTMMLADYFPLTVPDPLLERHADRLLYGSDFPILPYAWDRELRRVARLSAETREKLLSRNAERLFARS